MSHRNEHQHRHGHKAPEHPETATEEVVQEVENAETHPLDEEKREAEKDGEAADTLTPSPKAQEDAQNT